MLRLINVDLWVSYDEYELLKIFEDNLSDPDPILTDDGEIPQTFDQFIERLKRHSKPGDPLIREEKRYVDQTDGTVYWESEIEDREKFDYLVRQGILKER